MQLRPIRTEADYEAALGQIERLMDAEPDTSEGDCLDILTTLVEAYEAAHHPIEAPDPIAALEYFMEQRGITRADLVPLLGSRSRVSEILNRRRRLTIEMAWRLHRELGIPAEAVIRPYELAARSCAAQRR
jgi:HTH-type transcriptional regulator / antitoxin HigA